MSRYRPQHSGLLDDMPARHAKDVGLHNGGSSLIYLIHGVTGTPAEMLQVAHGLARRGWDVYLPTLPGHCGSVRDLMATTEQHWRDHVLRQLAYAKAHYERVFVAG